MCPFIESLGLAQLLTPIAVTFAIAFAVRQQARARFISSELSHNISRPSFTIEFGVLLSAGISLAIYNTAVFGFPLESAAKVVVGVGTMGFFIAMDTMLNDELVQNQNLQREGIDKLVSGQHRSVTRKFSLLIAVCIVAVGAVLLMLIRKELFYLSHQDSIMHVNEVTLGIMLESAFVIAVVGAYTLKVIRSNAELMQLSLDSQLEVLERVASGNYTSKVPLTTDDEFGQIAKFTNLMIESLKSRTEELERTQDVSILSLASLAETRDNETGAHILRTQRYVKALAQHLSKQRHFENQLTPEIINLLFKSAPLHDIGKVGIPDNILLKPGKLTEEEFATMKSHTVLGSQSLEVAERALGTTSFLRYAKEIAETHHEKWDGSGYPRGLSGEDIPLSGRLMAVADVYDALISKRVYKPAFSHDKAKGIILKGRGSHFDPALIDAFLACEQEFVRIANEFADDQQDEAA